jgi:RHS repeat-associated protein
MIRLIITKRTSANDYYPFGMVMPARSFTASSDYRFGFNGKEKDKNMSSLTAYDYGFRIYNPAIGKFLSVDPLTKQYPYYTPYQFAGNMPIWAIDLDGLEQKISTNVVLLKPVISIMTDQEMRRLTAQHNNPSSLNHPKELSNVNTSNVTSKRLHSDASQVFIGVASQGSIGLDQNPTVSVKKETFKNIETIEDLGKDGKYLKTEYESTTIFVDIHKGFLSGDISEIKITTTKSITYSKIMYQQPNGDFGTSLKSQNSYVESASSSTTQIPLSTSYEENLKKLPADLAAAVQASVSENIDIVKKGMQNLNGIMKSGEDKVNDGKLVPGKGKDYQGNNAPGKKDPYQHY